MKIFNDINICSIVTFILIFLGIGFIVMFFVFYSRKTKTERAININKKNKSLTLGANNEAYSLIENSHKDKDVIRVNKYLSDKIIFIEWNKRYPLIILAFFVGIFLLFWGLFLFFINMNFFDELKSLDKLSLLISVLTLITTIMIAVLQLANQKHLRLLENSRQGSMNILAKNEKLQEYLSRSFSALTEFHVYNFSNPGNSFLIKQIFEKTFGDVNINFNNISYLIAIPLEVNLDFLNLKIEKVDIINTAVQEARSDELTYIVKENNIFICYKKEDVFNGAIFYCLNNFRRGYKFNISFSLKSLETNMMATISTTSSFSSLIYKDNPELDGIYSAKIQSVMYKFDESY